MKVVVTGAAGFVGSTLCAELLRAGHSVVGIDGFTGYYSRQLKEGNVERLRRDDRFTLVEDDLLRCELGRHLDETTYVVHAAATPGLSRSWTHFDEYCSNNVAATEKVLAAVREHGVRKLVHISTSSVYGKDASGNERSPLRPVSPYGVTKLAAEKLVEAYHEVFDVPAVILRYFSVYGPRQRPDMAYNIFVRRLIAREPIVIFGDGTQTRSSTYVDDCVRGTIAALQRAPTGRVFNIGGGEVASVNRVVEILFGHAGHTVPIHYGPGRPGDQLHTAADCSAATAAFGYTPSTDHLVGLAHQYDWQLGAMRDLAASASRGPG